MKKLCLIYWMCTALAIDITAQAIVEKLKSAVNALEKDPQLSHGILGFYVVDAKTGKNVFAKNEQTGLAPASTQKIITSASAFELMGKNYRFHTYIRYGGMVHDGRLSGNLHITGNGDPTLGSWRWTSTTEQKVLERIVAILEKRSIREIASNIIVDDVSYSFQPIPDGWIWQDIGNYYGAGCWGLNWRENQYDLVLQSGKNIGDTTIILKTIPGLTGITLTNFITAAKKNSGDNGYIYATPFSNVGFATGTIPVEEKSFAISGSMPRPSLQFAYALEQKLKEKNIVLTGKIQLQSEQIMAGKPIPPVFGNEDSISSPILDSINYWFMRKSINLYGEALVKALALGGQNRNATTEKGVEIIKNFWSTQGLEKSAINIIDGSGLSPQNRVTTHALVKVLLYAKNRPWYSSFYESIPVFNGMKIKSGSITGARSFAGYHTSSSGNQYVFAIIVNNYDGSSGAIVQKMYKVLDVLK